jgi:H+/Cl- antiporter ClcA
VTPLFVIGATLGAALAPLLDLPVPVLAAVGFVAVFAAAANTPLACTIMGVELFGGDLIVVFAIGCLVAYVTSSRRGIYTTRRIHTAKGPHPIDARPRLAHWRRGRRGG